MKRYYRFFFALFSVLFFLLLFFSAHTIYLGNPYILFAFAASSSLLYGLGVRWSLLRRKPNRLPLQKYKLETLPNLNILSEHARSQVKHIGAERQETELILETLGEGVITVNRDLIVKSVNLVGSKMLGIHKRLLIDKSLLEPIDEMARPLLEKSRDVLLECLERQSIVTSVFSIGDVNKTYYDLIAVPKTQSRGAVLILQDKSNHYKILDMGKDFIANASHELRTPITIIKGFAETLQDLPELSHEMILEIIEKIVRNCQRMDNLIKSLLKLADIENLPSARFQECDLIALIENCRHLLQTVYPAAQIEIEKNREHIFASADPDILELAIMNLLDNAAKYSASTPQITISCQQLSNEVKIDVSDKGIGIPPSCIEHIFGRFYTVDKAHSRRLGGAGLGLSIVKTIIDKHDGKVAAASTLGKGTTFTITLPSQKTR